MQVLATRNASQQGAIMLMALMILLLTELLGGVAIEIGLMENKSSHYALEEQQAQQAADAGVDWGLEKIYLELQQPTNLNIEILPAALSCGNSEMRLSGDDETCRASIGEVVRVTGPIDDSGTCSYEFTCTGSCQGAREVLKVQAVYGFAGGYQIQGLDGQLSFVPRRYLNRGNLVNYTASI